MKPPRTGYYSLLQYCPDLARVEAANIGVILFSPEDGYLRARTAPANDRVRKFFGSTAGDLDQISAMKRMFERRLEVESGNIRDLAAFRRFASLLANELLVTPPRAVRVEEPDADLMQLFEELVTGRVRRELPPESGILSELRLVLELRGQAVHDLGRRRRAAGSAGSAPEQRRRAATASRTAAAGTAAAAEEAWALRGWRRPVTGHAESDDEAKKQHHQGEAREPEWTVIGHCRLGSGRRRGAHRR